MALFNAEKYLPAQLKSIIEQTLRPNQIVFVDDASSQCPDHMIEDILGNTDIEYIILKNNNNRGSNYAFRRGLDHADGDIILFSDQDDIWLLDKIKTVRDFFNTHKNASVVFNDCMFLVKEAALRTPTKVEVILSYSGSTEHFVAGCCTAFTRDILRAVNVGLYCDLNYDDQVHAIGRILKRRYFLNQPLQLYRRHADNQSVIPQNIPVINNNFLRKYFTRFNFLFQNYIYINLYNMSNGQLEVHRNNLLVLSGEQDSPFHDEVFVVLMIKLLKQRSYYEFILEGWKNHVQPKKCVGIFIGFFYTEFRNMLR